MCVCMCVWRRGDGTFMFFPSKSSAGLVSNIVLFVFMFLSVKFSGFSILTKWCRHYYYLIQNIVWLHKETRPLSSHWPTSPPHSSTPQATANLFCVSIGWPVLDMLYKRNHTLPGPYALASFT